MYSALSVGKSLNCQEMVDVGQYLVFAVLDD